MHYKHFKIIFLLLLSPGLMELHAQQVIPASGGEATGSGGTVSYTIGQVAYITNTGNEGTITQGVQQPYEILVISSIEVKYGINPELSVYPNPTSDYLKLKVKYHTASNLTYHLFDANGKLLESKKLYGAETNIQTDMLAPSIYYLKVSDNNKEVKTFKIIKN